MADNYLENKMEEHRRVAAAPKRHLSTTAGVRPGEVCLKIAPLRVLVTDGEAEASVAIVRRLRSAGCRVAFVTEDANKGRRLSQETGSRYYPLALGNGIPADITAAWGGVDVLVDTGGAYAPDYSLPGLSRVIVAGVEPSFPTLPEGSAVKANTICLRGISPENAAHLCLVLCLDGSSFIDRQSFKFA